MDIKVKKIVDNVLKTLPKKEREVLVMRFGLSTQAPKTLQKIGDSFGVTRESIRRTQNKAFERLSADHCVKELSSAFQHLEKAIDKCGGVATNSEIQKALNIKEEKDSRYIRLLLEVGDKFHSNTKKDKGIKTFWTTNKNEVQNTEKIISKLNTKLERNRNNLFTEKDIVDIISASKKEAGVNSRVASVCYVDKSGFLDCNPRGEWGHYKNPEIELKKIAGLISYVLREEGKPMHFKDIAKKVGKNFKKDLKEKTCHNELIRSPKFVLKGRGMYYIK